MCTSVFRGTEAVPGHSESGSLLCHARTIAQNTLLSTPQIHHVLTSKHQMKYANTSPSLLNSTFSTIIVSSIHGYDHFFETEAVVTSACSFANDPRYFRISSQSYKMVTKFVLPFILMQMENNDL